MTPLMKILIAVVLIYFLVTAFLKITKVTLKVVIVLLILGIFLFGYTSVAEIWETPPTEKFKEKFDKTNETNITIEPVDQFIEEDLIALGEMEKELDELERDLEEPPEVNPSEVEQ